MSPVLIGYFPKQSATPPGPARPPAIPANVTELCHVGCCDGLDPKGWVDAWLHNEFWVYDHERLAWGIALQTENLRQMHEELAKTWDGVRGSVQRAMALFIERHVPPPEACADWETAEPRWQIFAYRVFPTVFFAGRSAPLEFAGMTVGPLPPDYECLGYDPVSVQPWSESEHETGLRGPFGHSSLSPYCNGLCHDFPVNRFCLIETADEGLRRAEAFANGGGEPEPYVLIEVWRKRMRAAAPQERKPPCGE